MVPHLISFSILFTSWKIILFDPFPHYTFRKRVGQGQSAFFYKFDEIKQFHANLNNVKIKCKDPKA